MDGSSLAVSQTRYKFSNVQNKQDNSVGPEAVLAWESGMAVGVSKRKQSDASSGLVSAGIFLRGNVISYP